MLFDIQKDICIEKETLAFWKELDFGGPETFSLLLFLESSRVLGEPKLIYLEVVSISAQKIAHGLVQNWPGYNNSIRFSRDTARVRIECATKLFIDKTSD